MRFFHLFIGTMLVLIGLVNVFYWAYQGQREIDISLQEAVSVLGDRGGTLHLRPGQWAVNDRMVPKEIVNNGRDTLIRLPSGQGINANLTKEDALSLCANPLSGLSEKQKKEIMDYYENHHCRI